MPFHFSSIQYLGLSKRKIIKKGRKKKKKKKKKKAHGTVLPNRNFFTKFYEYFMMLHFMDIH